MLALQDYDKKRTINKKIKDAVKIHDSDRYVKRFKSKDHLISMLFCSFAKCNSLREVSGAMLGLSGKTEGFQLSHIPKRSTLSDANKNRKVEFFEEIYNKLLHQYGEVLSDTRIQKVLNKQVKIVDRCTNSLFIAILSCVCRKSREGKNIADLATLTELGKEIGLDETELQTAFSDDSYAYRVTQDIAEGRHIGVQGVPFFVLDRRYGVSGAQPPAVFLENLEAAFKEWRELNPESKLKMASNGPSCTPDGIC